MDSYHVYNLKIAKSNAISKHRQLRKITNYFRVIEVCIFLVLVSRFSTHLPVAVKNSGKYFRDISVILVSPRFVFVLGNVIVITLFAKSGQFPGQKSASKASENELYNEFVERSKSTQLPDIKYHKKQRLCKGTLITESPHGSRVHANYRRTQSQSGKSSQKQSHHERSQLLLRRSETDRCIRSTTNPPERSVKDSYPEVTMNTERCITNTTNPPERSVKGTYPEDNMSNEEFRCMVEAFIARQQRLRREEQEYSV